MSACEWLGVEQDRLMVKDYYGKYSATGVKFILDMTLKSIFSTTPWWLKIISKILLSRLPVSFAGWRKLDLFRHGDMNQGDYALRVFRGHLDRMNQGESLQGCTVLELGPGDGITSGLIAHAYGARRTYLVDSGNFVERDIAVYQTVLSTLEESVLPVTSLKECQSFDELCRTSHTVYLTDGLDSLKTIPTDSIDFLFSQAVLEHVRAAEFVETMVELQRILKPHGISSHRVDLKDHLGGALNNLRFSEQRWESPLFAEAGFYTNRIRFRNMEQIFKGAGFTTEFPEIRTWDVLPTPRQKMWGDFQNLPEDDLLVSGFIVVLRPKLESG